MAVTARLSDSNLIIEYGEKESKLVWKNLRFAASDQDCLNSALAASSIQKKTATRVIRRDTTRLS